jgi:hypothetical protein
MGTALSVSRLLESGFEEVACWTAKQHKLERPLGLPSKRGVYAFALGEQVVYVGLASRSLKQRLGFYTSPGASQKTNVRLNGIIRELIGQGQVVRILLAHPDDEEWNGLRLSGPEGLEAALIEDYDLPWNVRGSRSTAAPSSIAQSSDASRRARGTTSRAILDFVAANPRCSELEIAKGVFGPTAVQSRANPYCRQLVDEGYLQRLPTRPATYVLQAVITSV